MKTNKFLILAIMLISALTNINAQSFHVYRNGGNVSDFTIADVDSIVFDAPEDEGPRFHLKYSGLTSTSVTLSVTPEDNSVAYYYDCVTKEQLEESNGSIASVVEGYLSYLQQSYPTLSMENILEAILSKGPATDDVKGLPAGTDFIFYAIPVNKEGKCYGKPTTKNFSTLPGGDPAECTFDISYTDLTADGCNVIIKPSDPSVRYWMGITPFKDYPGDKALAMDVKENIESYAQSKGMTVAQVVKGVTFTDNIESQESGLDLNTSYYIYAYAMNEDASAAGKIYKLKFTTRASGASDADISIKYRYYDGDDLYNMDPTKYAICRAWLLLTTTLLTGQWLSPRATSPTRQCSRTSLRRTPCCRVVISVPHRRTSWQTGPHVRCSTSLLTLPVWTANSTVCSSTSRRKVQAPSLHSPKLWRLPHRYLVCSFRAASSTPLHAE